jgi:hypothetical protein
MSTAPQSTYVLSDIEARQDAVIKQLEELEARIAQVLAEYGVSVPQPAPSRPVLRVMREDEAAA